MIDRAFAREKKKDVFIQDALAEPNPNFGTCGRIWRPREGQRFPSSVEFFPKKGQRLPQRG
jgi:hypothetical protein